MILLNKFFTPDVILCLNGTISKKDKEYIQQFQDITLIAVDGAINQLDGVDVNCVIGDLDSIDTERSDFFTIKNTNQNKYDFEKALDYAISIGKKTILIVGINGGEYEHSLNNFSIFIKYSQLVNMHCITEGRIGVFVEKDCTLSCNIGDTLSLIPCPIAIISTNGLE